MMPNRLWADYGQIMDRLAGAIEKSHNKKGRRNAPFSVLNKLDRITERYAPAQLATAIPWARHLYGLIQCLYPSSVPAQDLHSV